MDPFVHLLLLLSQKAVPGKQNFKCYLPQKLNYRNVFNISSHAALTVN